MGFTVDGFWPAVLGGLVVSVVSIVMGMILQDELKGKTKVISVQCSVISNQ